MPPFTLIVPYYRQPKMLEHQLAAWDEWPRGGPRIIIVDDGSAEPAREVIDRVATGKVVTMLRLLRIDVDIPWNRNGARNLGSKIATTEWIVHVDIDHVLRAPAVEAMLKWTPDPAHWYRFERYRVGRADETRRKDKIPDDVEHGKIHPHMDSYLTTRSHYWAAGGYDEDYAGCLGGGTPFTKELAKLKPVAIAPPEISLDVWTRTACAESSERFLDRSPDEYVRRKNLKEASGRTRAANPIRFPWHEEALRCTRP